MGAGSLPFLRSCLQQRGDGAAVAARFHPQIEVRGAGDLLARANFSLPVAESETLSARYRTLDRLIGDLRANGLTNCLAQRVPLKKADYAKIAGQFSEPVVEQFSVVTLTGWARPEISLSSNSISGPSAGGISSKRRSDRSTHRNEVASRAWATPVHSRQIKRSSSNCAGPSGSLYTLASGLLGRRQCQALRQAHAHAHDPAIHHPPPFRRETPTGPPWPCRQAVAGQELCQHDRSMPLQRPELSCASTPHPN